MDAIDRVAWGPQGYAGFWQRVGGYLVDVLLFSAIALVVSLVIAVVAGVEGEDPVAFADQANAPVQIFLAVSYFLYDTILTHRQGATLGKRAAGIEVRRPDGALPSYGVCAGRYFARILSALPLGAGFVWAAFDTRKRTLHDLLVRTVVVRRAVTTPVGAPRRADHPHDDAPATPAPRRAEDRGGPIPPAPEPAGQAQAPPAAGWGAPPAGPNRPDDREPEQREPEQREPEQREQREPEQREPEQREQREPAHWQPGQPERWEPGQRQPVEREPVEREPVEPIETGLGPGSRLSGATLESARWGRAPGREPGGAQDLPATGGLAGEAPRGETPAGEAPAGEAPAAEPSAVEASVAGVPAAEAHDEGPAPAPPSAGAAGARPSAPDPNRVAIERARLTQPSAAWLQQIAGQVDARLDRVDPHWRASPQAPAARACAFGIFLGHLAGVHPHMAADISRVAEAHPSFSTLLAGSRLATLQQIAADPERATAWLGPLIDVDDPHRVARLLG